MNLKRYADLTSEDLNIEFQVHTTQTDGQASVAEILRAASVCGLAAIALTEHVRMETDWFPEFASAVREEAKAYPDLRVYVGCEAKALDLNGSLDVTKKIVDECDIVLGSVHRFPGEGGGYADWDQMKDAEFAKMEHDLSLGMMRFAPITVLAHPGGMFQRRRKQPFPEIWIRSLMSASIETGVAIEINSSYLRDTDGFLSLCQEINPYISIGSDSHTLDTLGQCRDVLRGKRQDLV